MNDATEIRSDLWTTMSPADLSKQMDIVQGRINALYACGAASNPVYKGILVALQQAETDITELLLK